MPGPPRSGAGMWPSSSRTRAGSAAQGFSSGPEKTAHARRPPVRSTRRVSASAAAGSAIEHVPPATEHAVDGVVVEGDALGVEHPALDVRQAEPGGVAPGRLDHRLGEVAHDHAAAPPDEGGRGQAHGARAGGQIEERPTRPGREVREHPLGDRPRDLLEEGRAPVPAGRHGRPHVAAGPPVLLGVHRRRRYRLGAAGAATEPGPSGRGRPGMRRKLHKTAEPGVAPCMVRMRARVLLGVAVAWVLAVGAPAGAITVPTVPVPPLPAPSLPVPPLPVPENPVPLPVPENPVPLPVPENPVPQPSSPAPVPSSPAPTSPAPVPSSPAPASPSPSSPSPSGATPAPVESGAVRLDAVRRRAGRARPPAGRHPVPPRRAAGHRRSRCRRAARRRHRAPGDPRRRPHARAGSWAPSPRSGECAARWPGRWAPGPSPGPGPRRRRRRPLDPACAGRPEPTSPARRSGEGRRPGREVAPAAAPPALAGGSGGSAGSARRRRPVAGAAPWHRHGCGSPRSPASACWRWRGWRPAHTPAAIAGVRCLEDTRAARGELGEALPLLLLLLGAAVATVLLACSRPSRRGRRPGRTGRGGPLRRVTPG